MPLQPNFIERILIKQGMIPSLLIDVGMSTFEFWALIGAMEIGLFEHLKNDALDVPTLAKKTNASDRGIEVLVRALEPIGYLDEKDGRYGLSKSARRSLPIDDLRDMAPFFADGQMMLYRNAADIIRENPPDGVGGWEHVKSGEVGRSYQTTMRWLASLNVEEVVKKVDLPDGARKMLDVGGAHGLYTVAFCRKYPELRGTILDWPIGLEAAQETLEENPDVADRIDLIERDFEREDLPEGYDFAFLGNIIHGISPEGNRRLFGKLYSATSARGSVVILDQFAGVKGSKFARGVAGLLGFNLFLFSGGRSYPYDDVKRWLADVGFTEADQKSLQQPGFSLVTAKKSS